MIDKIDDITCLEIYTILTELNLFKKLPSKTQNYIINTKNNEYIFLFDKDIPIQFQTTNKKTMVVLSYLYLKYINKNPKKGNILKNTYRENEEKYQKLLNEKYNLENKFKKINETSTPKLNLPIEIKKEKWYKKIFTKLIKMFKR